MENIEKLLMQILESQTAMQNDIQELRNGQTAMQNDIQDLKDAQKNMQKDIVGLQKDTETIKQGQIELKTEIKMVQGQVAGVINQITDLKTDFANFEALNAVRHTDLQLKLETIVDDIEFLKHEEYQTKQDVFKMRKKLEIIK